MKSIHTPKIMVFGDDCTNLTLQCLETYLHDTTVYKDDNNLQTRFIVCTTSHHDCSVLLYFTHKRYKPRRWQQHFWNTTTVFYYFPNRIQEEESEEINNLKTMLSSEWFRHCLIHILVPLFENKTKYPSFFIESLCKKYRCFKDNNDESEREISVHYFEKKEELSQFLIRFMNKTMISQLTHITSKPSFSLLRHYNSNDPIDKSKTLMLKQKSKSSEHILEKLFVIYNKK